MSLKASLINLDPPRETPPETTISLGGGRCLAVCADDGEERVEVRDSGGTALIRICLQDDGPVIHIQGARLELRSTESLALVSKKVRIEAEQDACIESRGGLDLKTAKGMRLHADEDVRVTGKTIHLN